MLANTIDTNSVRCQWCPRIESETDSERPRSGAVHQPAAEAAARNAHLDRRNRLSLSVTLLCDGVDNEAAGTQRLKLPFGCRAYFFPPPPGDAFVVRQCFRKVRCRCNCRPTGGRIEERYCDALHYLQLQSVASEGKETENVCSTCLHCSFSKASLRGIETCRCEIFFPLQRSRPCGKIET